MTYILQDQEDERIEHNTKINRFCILLFLWKFLFIYLRNHKNDF